MFINNKGQPETNRRYRDLAIKLRAQTPRLRAVVRDDWNIVTE